MLSVDPGSDRDDADPAPGGVGQELQVVRIAREHDVAVGGEHDDPGVDDVACPERASSCPTRRARS